MHYWRVGVDVGSEFGRQLRRWNIDAAAWRRRFFNVGRLVSQSPSKVELEIWIPDAFPTSPPKVRVLKPYFDSGNPVHCSGQVSFRLRRFQGLR